MSASQAPSISVVIPTFNRAEQLVRAVESVQRQSYPPSEVIVCDDGSQDETRQAIELCSGPVPVVYLFQSNSGLPASARNMGISQSRSEFIAFLDSDDWWSPNKICEMLRANLDSFDVMYHELAKTPPTSRMIHGKKVRSRQLRLPAFQDLLMRGNVIPNSSVVIRRSLLVEVGGLNEDPRVRSWEDFDLWLRVAQVTDRFHFVDKVLGHYSTGDGLTSPNQILVNHCNFEEIWLTPNPPVPGWIHQQRAQAFSALGLHRQAVSEVLQALKKFRQLRFATDVGLVAGLGALESMRSIRR